MNIRKQQTATPPADVNSEALAAVAHQTRDLLAFHIQLGISHYPASSELRRIAAKKTVPPVRPVVQQKRFKKPAQHPITLPAPAKVSRTASAKQLKVISRNISECQSCASASQIMIPGQGSPRPSLFIIGDWFDCPEDPKGLIWGSEEDDLLWKMMAAIGLDRDSVYVTNCIKCRPAAGEKPDTDRSGQCFTFLEQELMAIQPEFICTMGEMATNMLLKSSAPLVRMRGRFHQYRYPHGGSARVMPTFHPRVLIKNHELKPATWLDLQAIQRLIIQRTEKQGTGVGSSRP